MNCSMFKFTSLRCTLAMHNPLVRLSAIGSYPSFYAPQSPQRTLHGTSGIDGKVGAISKPWKKAHGVGRVVGALGFEAGFAGSMLN